MEFKNLPYNTSEIYLKVVLYNGCQLYVPLHSEGQKAAVKQEFLNFINWQAAQFTPEPEYA